MNVIANIHYIEAAAFLVVVNFDTYGRHSATSAHPIDNVAEGCLRTMEYCDYHKVASFATSTPELFHAFVQIPAFNCELWPATDASATESYLKTYKDELREVYDIAKETYALPPKQATGLRKWLVLKLLKNGGYTI